MVEVSGNQVRTVADIPPLPPYMTADEIFRDEIGLMLPSSRISVTDAAERSLYVSLSGQWKPFTRDVAPYMVEPCDVSQSRRFTAGCFVGPSQSGKSQGLINIAVHSVLHDPGPVQIIHMTKTDGDAWVEEKLDPAIANSPDIFARLGTSRDDDTFSRKRFHGMRLTVGYPKASQLSSRSQRILLMTDYDHFPQKLGRADNPEGRPFTMGRRRVLTYMSRGFCMVESSPAFPVVDSDFQRPENQPHIFPPVDDGVCLIYNDGTRGRWYWKCPECGALFEPRIDRLHYDRKLEPGAAGEAAEMVCSSGCLLPPRVKVELNRAALRGEGGWLHESQSGELVGIGDSSLRKTSIASWALDGAAAAFSSWGEIVAEYEAARRIAEETGDDADLAVCNYTSIGRPHKRAKKLRRHDLTVEKMKANAANFPRGYCPSWTRFVTVQFDVQRASFPAMVMAHGARGERAVVDRLDITQPPADAPNGGGEGKRAVDPGSYIEDWETLLPFADRSWPVLGKGFALKAVALCVDFQGAPGVSDRATDFWTERAKAGETNRWFVTRGQGGFRTKFRTKYERPEGKSGGGPARRIMILTMATDRLKDTVAAAIARVADGPNRQHCPVWMTDEGLLEFISEERLPVGWRPRDGLKRNENFDLSVQAAALADHMGVSKINYENPPSWAVNGPNNLMAIEDSTLPAPEKVFDKSVEGGPERKQTSAKAGGYVEKRDWF